MLKWQLKTMCLRRGGHLPKRVRFAQPIVPAPAPPPFEHAWGGAGGYNQELGFVSQLALSLGNLNNMQYRFWLGVPYIAKTFAQCRCCLQVLDTTELKDNHAKLLGCNKYLIKAYDELCDLNECIICGQETKNTAWGIPICKSSNVANVDCQVKWKYLILQPEALQTALWEGLEAEPNEALYKLIFD